MIRDKQTGVIYPHSDLEYKIYRLQREIDKIKKELEQLKHGKTSSQS